MLSNITNRTHRTSHSNLIVVNFNLNNAFLTRNSDAFHIRERIRIN